MAAAGMSEAVLAKFRERFEADPRYRLARNVATKQDILEVLKTRDVEEQLTHVFSHKLDIEGKPVTNQKSSGRCWIFACLNCMRLPLIKQLNLEEFEFSQNYVYYYDKLERFNYLLHSYLNAARKGEAPEGRLLYHLNFNPSEDGGQWAMLVNLIEKYGVLPKKCFPDSWSCEESRRLGSITNCKLREFCMKIFQLVQQGKSDDEVKKEIEGMIEEIYRIINVCLGTPPTMFTWEYYDKNKQYHKIGPISPLDFYKEYVKPLFNLEEKIVLVNDPRPDNPYNGLYTVEYLNNMVGGRNVLYINVEVETLKKYAAESIKQNEAVWFGCDVGKHCSWKKLGFEDLKGYDYELVFGTSLLNMSKAERLIFRESLMTHAMVLTAVTEEDGVISRWRIENSWGDQGGEKGYMSMADDWFSEFVYEVVVDKRFVPPQLLNILKQEPKVLPAWDPMGSLARASPSRACPSVDTEVCLSKL